MSIANMYTFETCRRLDPVQEERMREAIWHTERIAIRHDDVEPGFIRIIDAFITTRPPGDGTYLQNAAVVRSTFTRARPRAKKRRIWWLPWRRGGGRG